MDRDNATFVDPDKVRRIEHVGRFFKSRGPLNVVRSPQNGPAILQAGTSPKGKDFAARYADGIFAIQPRAEDAARHLVDLHLRVPHGVQQRLRLEQQAVADLKSLAKGRRSVGLAMPKLEDAELAGTLTRTLTLALILALALTLPLTQALTLTRQRTCRRKCTRLVY